MEVRLVVTNGKKPGQLVPVTVERFFIGRAEDCHLRPNTDLISRHHCVITVEDDFVTIRDLGSRNGTSVNGERIRGEEELNDGDKIAVGPLEFRVEFVVETAASKEPEVKSVQGAAKEEKPEPKEARKKAASVESPKDSVLEDGDEFDLSNWLGDADEINDTRSMNQTLVGTTSFGKDQDDTSTKSMPLESSEEEQETKDKKKTRKDAAKKPGRLPTGLKKPKTADSQAAAADTLRHFFHRR